MILLCWLFGHKIGWLSVNVERRIQMLSFHDRAGCDSVCFRCGDRMNDAMFPPRKAELAKSHPYR